MDIYLEKRVYVYRRSFEYFSKINILLSLGKFLFSASALSALISAPLAALSIGAGIIDILEKSLKISERKQEYKQGYKFYSQLLSSFKAGSITEAEIYIKEQDFVKNLNFFPLEKFIRKAQLNGYQVIQQ